MGTPVSSFKPQHNEMELMALWACPSSGEDWLSGTFASHSWASPASLSPCTGNQDNNFRIHVSSGLLMRGPQALDRERNSSHVLLVEAYNHDLGPMRSSVRVSGFRTGSW